MDLSEISDVHSFKTVEFDGVYPPPVAETIKKFDTLEVISMIYKSDGLKIHGYIFKKKGLDTQTPVVIYCRGGNNRKGGGIGELKAHRMFYIKGLLKLVNEGRIIVFASNYRGSERSEGDDEFCGKDINDIINLYPIIEKYKIADPTKIGIYGWSRGCPMALMVARKVKWLKCIIIGAGVYDFTTFIHRRPKMYKMLTDDFGLSEEDLKNRSAMNWANELPKIPMLLLHGSGDWRVSAENSLQLSIKLLKYKIPYKLTIYPGGDHGLTEYAKPVSGAINHHLERFLLKDGKVNLEPHGR
jgi:dipeptidyl aminopeptidase/acylaminoacyl peptidase